MTLAKYASSICHPSQRGFLSNRFLADSVLEMVLQSRKHYIADDSSHLLLFDLTAAFPSLNQDSLWKGVQKQNIPENWIHALKLLYRNNDTFLQVDGVELGSFRCSSGVRQGCPLSPVLFALAMDPFIRMCNKKLNKNATLRAYSHDPRSSQIICLHSHN